MLKGPLEHPPYFCNSKSDVGSSKSCRENTFASSDTGALVSTSFLSSLTVSNAAVVATSSTLVASASMLAPVLPSTTFPFVV